MEDSPALAAWRQAGEHLPLCGQSLFVRRQLDPQRPALLLIHGFPSAGIDWAPLWPVLAAQFAVCAPDLLGLGFSAKPADFHYTVAAQADFCAALIAANGWSGQVVHVLAHDLGDTVAQELLARHLERRMRLGSVVFLNGGLFPEAHRPRLVQRLLATPLLGRCLVGLLGKQGFVANMRAIAGTRPPSPEVLDDLWTLLCHDSGRWRLPQLLGYMAERRRRRERWVGALLRADVPLRLVCGEADPISGAHLADRYAELLPGADVVRLPGIGHYPQLEDPEAVLTAVLGFHRRLAVC